jgi:tetratricopeptide (TPR) repeat protein
VLGELGELELYYGSPQAAREAFHKAASIQPLPTYLANLGTAALLLGEYDEAVTYYHRAMARGSRLPALLLSLAYAYTLIGNQTEATKLYTEIIGTVDESGNTGDLACKAVALAQLGQIDQALVLIRETLAASDAIGALPEAATVYALSGDYEEAARLARMSLSHGMNPAWFNLPWFEQLELDKTGPEPGGAE